MQNSVKVLCISLIFLPNLSHSYASQNIRLSFLPGSDALGEEIKRARVSIDLGLFYLTHDAIIDALCYKASQKNARGQRLLRVRIYVDATIKDKCCGDENEGKIWDGDESKQCCCGDELKDKDDKDLDCDKFCDGGIVCDTEDPSIQQKMDSAVMKVAPIAWQKTRNDRIDPDEPFSAREFGGLICCNDDKIKAMAPYPGQNAKYKYYPPNHPYNVSSWTSGAHVPGYNYQNGESVSCEKEYGQGSIRKGDYHTHLSSEVHTPANDDGGNDQVEGVYVITPSRRVIKWHKGKAVFVGSF